MLDALVTILETIANFGAGATSVWLSYQPKTPACLMEDEE